MCLSRYANSDCKRGGVSWVKTREEWRGEDKQSKEADGHKVRLVHILFLV